MNKNTETKSGAQAAIESASEVLATLQDMNNFLTTSQVVRPVYHAHYANMETGVIGIEKLIADILKENDSVFPAKSEETALRQIAIAGSMFTQQILDKVHERFTAGSPNRYPMQTILKYLGGIMLQNGTVGKIQTLGCEDLKRDSNRPRVKWYLVNK
jgi:hypothetical protein